MDECKPLARGARAARGGPRPRPGGAVQVDPIKPMLKVPGTKRLKLKYDILPAILLQFCFQFQLAPLHPGGGAARWSLCSVLKWRLGFSAFVTKI